MHIPAKVDYGLRALLTLAAADMGREPADPAGHDGREHPPRHVARTAESLAAAQGLPQRFLGAILTDLRRAGIVASQRGVDGGYRLAREPAAVTLADVMRALDGPLAEVRGLRPEAVGYDGAAENLQEVWVAVRASLRQVLEHVTLADVVSGSLPEPVTRFTADPESWQPH